MNKMVTSVQSGIQQTCNSLASYAVPRVGLGTRLVIAHPKGIVGDVDPEMIGVEKILI